VTLMHSLVNIYGLHASRHKLFSPEPRHRYIYIYFITLIFQISIYTISVGLFCCVRSPI